MVSGLIDRETTVLAAKHVLAGLPEGYCYERSKVDAGYTDGLRCVYARNDRPVCLVGHVLAHLGLLSEITPSHNAVEFYFTAVSRRFTDDSVKLLIYWQERQDASPSLAWEDIVSDSMEVGR